MLTLSALRARMKYWKAVLALSDWRVTLGYTRDANLSDAWGDVEFDRLHRRAHIRILDPRDADPDDVVPYDAERILVHELLHLVLSPLDITDIETPAGFAQEQVINQIAFGLVELNRKKDSSI